MLLEKPRLQLLLPNLPKRPKQMPSEQGLNDFEKHLDACSMHNIVRVMLSKACRADIDGVSAAASSQALSARTRIAVDSAWLGHYVQLHI
jgi:hypothetical protein